MPEHIHSMAERSGDPELDGLIDMFMEEEAVTDWPNYWQEVVENAEYPGWSEGQAPSIEHLADPNLAEGMCVSIATQFIEFIEAAAPHLQAWLPNKPYPEEFGYTDRPRSGSPCHAWAYVQASDGSVYGIDFTATQYGYVEHPMVQRLQNPELWENQEKRTDPDAYSWGEPKMQEQWQRTWSKTANQSVLHANRGRDLQNLPQKPTKVGPYGELQFGSHGGIQQAAEEYMQQAGLPYRRPELYVKADPERASRIAQEYERMPHAPDDPAVQRSYQALKDETMAQYQKALEHGYNYEFYPEGQDPYPFTPREAVLDLHKNKHMFVYPTSAGFGSEDTGEHPLLEDTGLRWNDKPVTHNDLFRVMHDFYGHAKEGLGFRADGEENAWRQHAAMFSEAARPAMTAETRGQNSWVNFGPYGAQNQGANQAETVYAPQKAGIMPSWVNYTGAQDDDYMTAKVGMAQLAPDQIMQLSNQVEQLAQELGGLQINFSVGGEAWAGLDSITIHPITTDVNYLVALHELGHVAYWVATSSIHDPSHRWQFDVSESEYPLSQYEDDHEIEAWCWNWARQNSLIPVTEEMWQHAKESVGTYHADPEAQRWHEADQQPMRRGPAWETFQQFAKTAEHLLDDRGQMEEFFLNAAGGEYTPAEGLRPEHGPQDWQHQPFYEAYQRHGGEFTKHIDTSIPQYAANMANKGYALTSAFPGAKVIDIASGEGSFVKALAEHGAEAHGLEPNRAMNEHFNKTQVPGAKHIQMAYGEKGFEDNAGQWYAPHAPDGTYDVVHESMGFQFIGPERDEQIEHAKRYLKPGGLLITDQKVSPGESPYDQAMWQYHEGMKDAWKGQYYSPEQLAQKNEIVGFQPEAGWRPIRKLGGFFVWTADIHALAEKMREKLMGQYAPSDWGNQPWSFGAEEAGVVRNRHIMNKVLYEMPDEGFKLMPWAARELRRGEVSGATLRHFQDILNNASKWFAWSREHNKSIPDFMKRDFGFEQMEQWVYELNATQQGEEDEWADSEIVYQFPDGWHMDRVGPQDLAREGELMGHCVGGYCETVRSGRSSIFSLRDPKGQPHVTIEVEGEFSGLTRAPSGQDLTVVQVQGKQDSEPIPEYREKVDEWFGELRGRGYYVTEQDPEREPEYEYEEHYEGPYTMDDPESVRDYHTIMMNQYDRREHFGEDEEGNWEDNTITYQIPRRLEWNDHDLVRIGNETIDIILRQPDEYDESELIQIAQGLWMATHHQAAVSYNYGVEAQPDARWNDIVRRITDYYRQVIEPQEKWADPSLFDPNVYNEAQANPTAESFIYLLERLGSVDKSWTVTTPPMKVAPWHTKQFPGQPEVREFSLDWPGTGSSDYHGGMNYDEFFERAGLNTLRPSVGTVFAKTAWRETQYGTMNLNPIKAWRDFSAWWQQQKQDPDVQAILQPIRYTQYGLAGLYTALSELYNQAVANRPGSIEEPLPNVLPDQLVPAFQQLMQSVIGSKTAGMMDMMVSKDELESILKKHFRYVTQYWSSGNFKGYAASDDPNTIQQFLSQYKFTNHGHEAENVPVDLNTRQFTSSLMRWQQDFLDARAVPEQRVTEIMRAARRFRNKTFLEALDHLLDSGRISRAEMLAAEWRRDEEDYGESERTQAWGWEPRVGRVSNVADLIATTLTNGGGTFQQDLSPATFAHGYIVSLKGYGAVIPVNEFSEKEVSEWVKDVPLQAQDLIGTWVDQGNVHLDVSQHFDEFEDAKQFGITNDQQAIYDAGSDSSIDLNPFK